MLWGTRWTSNVRTCAESWVMQMIANVRHLNFKTHSNWYCRDREGQGQDMTMSADLPLPFYLHEMGHVLGLPHEQDRQDRDDWIFWDNNKPGCPGGKFATPVEFLKVLKSTISTTNFSLSGRKPWPSRPRRAFRLRFSHGWLDRMLLAKIGKSSKKYSTRPWHQ